MMSTIIPPDEERLTQQVRHAFDALPEPEASRLEALEQRLVRQRPLPRTRRRPPQVFWWLMAALMATGAAAWWVGEALWPADDRRHQAGEVAVGQPNASDGTGAATPAEEGASIPEGEAGQGTKRPGGVIYRREQY